MALDLMSLRAGLFLDDSQYKQGLNDAKSGLSDFASTAKKVVAGLGITAAVKKGVDSIVSLTKSAVNAYGEFEQLAGGVETLFKDSADVVKQYAKDAYMTAGLSTNEYMETVTSFSASLLQSLGGDTKAAADLADQAIRDMSDNANKMGSDMSSIQNAYQGFAKGNYTMLDNLKLGYGGTKAEMDRLITDAMKLDKSFQANTKTVIKNKKQIKELDYNYADVVRAINIVQTNMGITGTTAKEAADTIQGSIASTKAAWENVLTAIGSGGDMKEATSNLVKSARNVLKNVTPVIKRALKGIGEFVTEVTPKIIKEIPKLVTGLLPSIVKAVPKLITGATKAIPSALSKGLNTIKNVLMTNGVQKISRFLNELITGGADKSYGPAQIKIQAILTRLFGNVFEAVQKAIDIGKGIIDKVTEVWTTVLQPIFQDAVSFVVNNVLPVVNDALGLINKGLDALPSILGDVVEAIKKGDWAQAGSIIWESIKSGFNAVSGWLLKLVLGDDYTPEAGWGDAGAKIWSTIKAGFAVVNDWLIKLLMGDDWTPDAGWGDVGAKIWQSIKDGFAVANDWLIKLLLGEEEYTPDATWSDVGAKIWGKIIEGLGSAVDWLKDLLDGWTEKLTDGSIDFASIGSTVGSTIWGAIQNAFSTVVDWFKNLFGGESEDDGNSVKGAIYSIDWAGLGTSIFGFIGAAFSGIVEYYTGYFQSALDAIKELDWAGLGDAMWSAIKGAFATVASWFTETFKAPINTVIGFLNSLIAKVRDALNTVVDAINNTLHITIPSVNIDFDITRGLDALHASWDFRNPLWNWSPNIGRLNWDDNAIPLLARGGIVGNGGGAIVGEYEPEYLRVIGGKAVVTPMNTGRFPGGGGQEIVVPRNQSRDITIILELDHQQFGKAVYKANNDETQRVGMRLSKGGAY